METLEIVKSDFSEFTTTMTEDTTHLLNSATAQFVEKSNTASFLLDTFDNKVKIETNNRLKILVFVTDSVSFEYNKRIIYI